MAIRLSTSRAIPARLACRAPRRHENACLDEVGFQYPRVGLDLARNVQQFLTQFRGLARRKTAKPSARILKHFQLSYPLHLTSGA
jgi:hypothetical protein